MFLYVYISIYIDTFNLKLPGCKNMGKKHIDKIAAVSSPACSFSPQANSSKIS